MAICVLCTGRSYSFLRKPGLLWPLVRILSFVNLSQIGTGISLFFLGLIGMVNYGDSLQWFFASAVFGSIPCLAGIAGYYSLRQDTNNIVYRLLQVVHVALNLLLVPGCGYTTVLMCRIISSTYEKLSQTTWSWEEQAEEMSLQGLRISLVICYILLIVEQLVGSFLGGFLLTNFPALTQKLRYFNEPVEKDRSSSLELRTVPAALGTVSTNRSIRSL